jgi:hypothetical protein
MFRTFTIDAPVPPAQVRARLQAVTRPPRAFREHLDAFWGRFEPEGPAFIGDVDDDSFSLRRDIRYHNAFLPQIEGSMVAAGVGTQVSVHLSIGPISMGFMSLWMIGFGIGSVHALFRQHTTLDALVPLAMFVVVALLV